MIDRTRTKISRLRRDWLGPGHLDLTVAIAVDLSSCRHDARADVELVTPHRVGRVEPGLLLEDGGRRWVVAGSCADELGDEDFARLLDDAYPDAVGTCVESFQLDSRGAVEVAGLERLDERLRVQLLRPHLYPASAGVGYGGRHPREDVGVVDREAVENRISSGQPRDQCRIPQLLGAGKPGGPIVEDALMPVVDLEEPLVGDAANSSIDSPSGSWGG